jgi:hypothetical protein
MYQAIEKGDRRRFLERPQSYYAQKVPHPSSTDGTFSITDTIILGGAFGMVERKIELRRRRQRREKLRKLKSKLATAKDPGKREEILRKIHQVSPWWQEPSAT